MTITWRGPIYYSNTGEGPTAYSNDSGVYLIYEKNDYSEIVKYVGQADNIRERMTKHRSNDEENEKLKELMQNRINNVRVRYTTVHEVIRRNNLEHTMFYYFGGLEKLYNKIIPRGVHIEGLNYPI